MKRNTASQTIGVQMISAADGSAFTGTVTAYVTGDNGTQALGAAGSGICVHKGNGYHVYGPTQAETNYAHIAFTFIGAGAVPVTAQLYTGWPQSDDVLLHTIDGLPVREHLMFQSAGIYGKSNTGGTVFRDVADTRDAVQTTMSGKNRTVVILDNGE